MPDDVEACIEILLGYPWTRYALTADQARTALLGGLEQMARGVSRVHVAASEGAVAGFVWWMPHGAFFHSGYIRLIGVSPTVQRHGTGRALVQTAEEAVITESRDMLLLVSDFNVSAQAFYRRLGYQHIGALPDYVMPGISELLMRKRLR